MLKSYLKRSSRTCGLLTVVLLLGAASALADNDIPITPPHIAPASNEGELAIGKMKLPKDLKAELFAAEPMVSNPVAICVDGQGRVYVAETYRIDHGIFDVRGHMDWLEDDLAAKTVEDRIAMLHRKLGPNFRRETQGATDRIVRLEDNAGEGKADKSTIFADGFNHSAEGIGSGVLERNGNVYYTDIPNLWLLRDTTGNGTADVRKSLSYGYGLHYSFFGHDLHGLRFGPDGKLYFSIGDRAANVTKSVDGRTVNNPESGAVFRCNADGTGLELYAAGLRNPQSRVFDQYGNLFTGDNNPDYGDPARLVYVVEGGDNGWRVGYQEARHPIGGGPWMWENLWEKQDKLDAYSQLPAVGFPGTGPSGIAYYPGTGLPERYENHLFLCDFHGGFTGSGVQSIVANPRGASFEMSKIEHFVWDCLATDICFAPSGGVYISDWVQGWNLSGKGRIYHIFDPDLQKDPTVLEVKKLLEDGMSKRPNDELIHLLAHRDMRIRQAAQFELADRGAASVEALTALAQHAGERLPRIHAIWALGQIAEAQKSTQTAAGIVSILSDADDEVRAQAEKTLGSLHDADAYDATIKLLSDPSPRVRFFAAMAAGNIGRKDAGGKLIEMLRANDDKDAFLRYAGVWALAQLNDSSTLAEASKDSSPAVRMAALLTYRRLASPEVAQFLNDSDPHIVLEAARAIYDTYIEAARPALAALWTRTGLDQRVIVRVLNSNYRLGTPEAAQALATFAATESQPAEWRIEALRLLEDWEHPSNLDQIMNLYRPLEARDVKVAQEAAGPALKEIFKTAPDSVKAAAIELMDKLNIQDTSVAMELVTNSAIAPALRAAALQLLADRNDPKLSEAVQSCLSDKDVKLRAAAIRCLAKLPDGTERLEAAMKNASVPEEQAVYDALAQVHTAGADRMIAAGMDQLLQNQLPKALWLEVLEAASHRADPTVHEKYAQYEASLPKDDHLAAYRESLEGGDAAAGEKIFRLRADVSCVRCHTAEGKGGVVGPVLDGVGQRQTRQYILESIVDPNAKIAPGFESAVVKTRNGKMHVGVVRKEDAQYLVLIDGDGRRESIDKSEIISRERGLSAMPQDIAKTLSKRDLRDLVEFLDGLKTPPKGTAPGAEPGGVELK
jgi:quinoprotein glucose dehydrogenase